MPIPVLVCELVKRGTPKDLPQGLGEACGKLAPVLDGLVPLPSAADVITALQSGQPPPVPGLALPTEPAAPAAPQAALPLPGLPGAPTGQPEGERVEPTSEQPRPESTGRAEPDDERSDENQGTEERESDDRSGLSGLFGGGDR
jgi:phospholipid/cholesterol/gamma-HCH transport system substrate-binding protein